MDLSLHPHLDWAGLLQDWARSEQSPEALAQTLGLAESVPAKSRSQDGGLFQRAEVVDARPPSKGAGCRIHLPGGTALEVDDSVDPHWAAALIRALEPSA
ncbi:hypothetical protein [Thiohalorhabdus methylotrophus]|uniref:Uncharacterized protein n=1 Tax=Thiohalorhabdus methylotrophus TaxID=3242694 RepID=A0ABV4U1F1_9GAMM